MFLYAAWENFENYGWYRIALVDLNDFDYNLSFSGYVTIAACPQVSDPPDPPLLGPVYTYI